MITLIKSYRPTILGLLILIAFAAALARIYTSVLVPGYVIWARGDEYCWIDDTVVDTKPFWPQFWRSMRNIPEPLDADEICRVDDGGLVSLAILTTAGIMFLVFRYRKLLVRRAPAR